MIETIAAAAIPAIIGGLMGPKNKVPRNVQHIQRMQMLAMKGMSDFANSAPLTDPMERMALAQSRGLLGAEQMGQRDALYSAFNPMTDAANMGDLLRNLTTEQVGQRMNLDMSHLFEALNARRSAMGQITGMGAQSLPAAGFQPQQSGPDFGSIFGNLANIYAQSRTRQPNVGLGNDLGRLMGGANSGAGATGTTTFDPLAKATIDFGSRFK